MSASDPLGCGPRWPTEAGPVFGPGPGIGAAVQDWGGLDRARLTPLQRILLITDGTVTEILGAYRGEPIRIVKLHQGIEPAPTDWPALEIAAGEPLLRRRILLVGQETGEVLIAADSRCVLARLPEGIRVALLTTTRPIGQLLLEARLETFREVLRCGLCPWPEAAAAFDLAAVQPLVVRVYRVLAGGQPLMEITEGFPPAP